MLLQAALTTMQNTFCFVLCLQVLSPKDKPVAKTGLHRNLCKHNKTLNSQHGWIFILVYHNQCQVIGIFSDGLGN